MYRTNKDLELTAFDFLPKALRTPFTLPAGSKVELVPQMDGLKGDGFAAGDVDQIIALTGNSHDPRHRYLAIQAADVDGETPLEIAEVDRIRSNEASSKHP